MNDNNEFTFDPVTHETTWTGPVSVEDDPVTTPSEITTEQPQAVTEPSSPVSWPKSLGKYGRLGVKTNDPRVYDKGEAVELLLSRAGWKGEEFTEEFANEVKQIQEENNIPATGRVDQKTWHVIVNK